MLSPSRRVRPREVEHRDAEVNHLSSVLEPITNGEPADTAIVTGPSGTGKTCISKFVTERLRKEVLDVEATLRQLLAQLHPIPDALSDPRRPRPPSTSTASRRRTTNSSTDSNSTTAREQSLSLTRSISWRTPASSTTSTASRSSQLFASRTRKRSCSAASTTGL